MIDNILITGSSRGIGLAICKRLLDENYKVFGLSRTRSTLSHKNFSSIQIDLSDTESLLPHFKKIDFLPDAIICNAGIGVFGNLEEIALKDIYELFNINLFSHITLVKHFLPLMKKRKKGKIIFIGSEAALKGKKKEVFIVLANSL